MNGGQYGWATGQREEPSTFGWPPGLPFNGVQAPYSYLGAQAPGGRSMSGGGFYGTKESGSFQGGAAYGSRTTQSIQGGAQVSGISMALSSDNFSSPQSIGVGFFVKLNALPASDMTLFDMDGGTTAYFRVKVTSAGHVKVEASYHGVTATVDVTPTTVIVPGSFYWIGASIGPYSNQSHFEILSQVTGPGGVSDGQQVVTAALTAQSDTISWILGWGISLTTSYLAFPNASGYELSKLEVKHVVNLVTSLGVFSVPTADPATTGLSALYLCRDTLGAQSVVVDSTSNHFDLTAGAQGLTVVADGPYA